MHLFSGEAPPLAEESVESPPHAVASGSATLVARVAALETEVSALREELEALKAGTR